MRRPLLPTLTLALLLPSAALAELPELSHPESGAVDAVFAEWDHTDRPGCSLGVYRDGSIVYTRGYGMANLEHGLANGPDTVFRIGSTSKQFTATAMALLAEEGKVSLDADLREIFPELPDYGAPLTIRHLLHHTSGVRDYLTLAWVADWSDDYTIPEALRLILAQRELNFPPGEQYLYSNSNYFLMSQIVERVTGESLRQWAAEHLFGPLGMTESHFHDDHTHIVPHRAAGYSPADGGGYRIDQTILDMVGDGGVFTTVRDLARWDAHFVANPLGGGAELIREMETPGTLADGSSTGYGFGLSAGEHRGLRMISHGGAFVGFRAAMNRFPDEHLSVAVLCNSSTADPGTLALGVADLYLAERLAPQEAEVASGAGDGPAVAASEAELRRAAGHYWSASGGLIRELVVEDGHLFYVRSGDSRSELAPLGGGAYRMLGVPSEVVVRCEPRGTGSCAGLTVEVAGEAPTVLERYEPATPTASDLAGLAGSWYSAELDATRRLELRDGVLVLLSRLEDLSLAPVVADVFTADGLVLRFQRDAEGAIAGLLVDAGRVRNLRFVRRDACG